MTFVIGSALDVATSARGLADAALELLKDNDGDPNRGQVYAAQEVVSLLAEKLAHLITLMGVASDKETRPARRRA